MKKLLSNIQSGLSALQQLPTPTWPDSQLLTLSTCNPSTQALCNDDSLSQLSNAFTQSGWFAHNWIENHRKNEPFSIALFLQKCPTAAQAIGIEDPSTHNLNAYMSRLTSPSSHRGTLTQVRNRDVAYRRVYLKSVYQLVEQIDQHLESLKCSLQSYQQLLNQLPNEHSNSTPASNDGVPNRLHQTLSRYIGLLTSLTDESGLTQDLLTLSTQTTINNKMAYARGAEKFQLLQAKLNRLLAIGQVPVSPSAFTGNASVTLADLPPLIDQLEQRYQQATQASSVQQMVECINQTLNLPTPITTPEQISAWVDFFDQKKKTTPQEIAAQPSHFLQLQLKRLTLFRMLQTTPQGELNLEDWFVIYNGCIPQSVSSAEDLYFQLFSEICSQLGMESLYVDQHDNKVLFALEQEFWREEQNIGSHALHMLANSRQAGQAVNYTRLITRCIKAFPTLLNLRARHKSFHQNWNLLHFVLFHFVRTQSLKKAQRVRLCQKDQQELETIYPGITLLVNTIKSIARESYGDLVGHPLNATFEQSRRSKKLHQGKNSDLITVYVTWAKGILALNSVTNSLYLEPSRKQIPQNALLPPMVFYSDLAVLVFGQHLSQPNLRALEDLNPRRVNTPRPSPRENKRKSFSGITPPTPVVGPLSNRRTPPGSPPKRAKSKSLDNAVFNRHQPETTSAANALLNLTPFSSAAAACAATPALAVSDAANRGQRSNSPTPRQEPLPSLSARQRSLSSANAMLGRKRPKPLPLQQWHSDTFETAGHGSKDNTNDQSPHFFGVSPSRNNKTKSAEEPIWTLNF